MCRVGSGRGSTSHCRMSWIQSGVGIEILTSVLKSYSSVPCGGSGGDGEWSFACRRAVMSRVLLALILHQLKSQLHHLLIYILLYSYIQTTHANVENYTYIRLLLYF